MTTPDPSAVEPLSPIPVGEQLRWNESQYAWWYDEAAGVAGFHRVAHMPNDGAGKAQMWHVILTHDGRRFRRCAELRFDSAWRRDGAYRAEGLTLKLSPAGLAIAYESPECASDLRFENLHVPVEPMRQAGAANALIAAGHVEAAGRVTGTVVLDGDVMEVDGLGYRDHSWGGQRDMRPFRSTRWANGTIGPGFSFGVGYLTSSGFSDTRFGWMLRDGVPVLVNDFDLIVDYELDGVCWRTASLVLRPPDGPPVEIEFGPTFDGVVVQTQEWMPYETATRIRMDGVCGVGNIESAANARGGLEAPRVVLAACTQEGLSLRPGANIQERVA